MMGLFWKVHTKSLLQEILSNSGSVTLTQPLRIFGGLLQQVAARAIELDDPQLNILMLRLTLYEQGDPEKFSGAEIDAAYAAQQRRLEEAKAHGARQDRPA